MVPLSGFMSLTFSLQIHFHPHKVKISPVGGVPLDSFLVLWSCCEPVFSNCRGSVTCIPISSFKLVHLPVLIDLHSLSHLSTSTLIRGANSVCAIARMLGCLGISLTTHLSPLIWTSASFKFSGHWWKTPESLPEYIMMPSPIYNRVLVPLWNLISWDSTIHIPFGIMVSPVPTRRAHLALIIVVKDPSG